VTIWVNPQIWGLPKTFCTIQLPTRMYPGIVITPTATATLVPMARVM